MPGWLCDLLITIPGVFLGALLAYIVTRLYDAQETRARRAALFRALHRQLSRHALGMPRFVRGIHNHIDPITVSAIGHLLASDVLDARKDGELIEKLSDLVSRIEQLNEIGRTYNLAFSGSELYASNTELTNLRGTWHQTYDNIYRDTFVKLRDEVLAMLPADSGPGDSDSKQEQKSVKTAS